MASTANRSIPGFHRSGDHAHRRLSMGGAIDRVASDATAFPYRDARWLFNVPASWVDPVDSDYEIAWVRDTFAAIRPFSTGGAQRQLRTAVRQPAVPTFAVRSAPAWLPGGTPRAARSTSSGAVAARGVAAEPLPAAPRAAKGLRRQRADGASERTAPAGGRRVAREWAGGTPHTKVWLISPIWSTVLTSVSPGWR